VTPVRVKICGITSPEDGVMAAAAGADAVGFVFWPKSPRFIDLTTARAISRALPPFVIRVGVWVNPELEEVAQAVTEAGLDVVQLHGSEPPDLFGRLPRRGVKALPVGPDFRLEDALRYQGPASGILLDTQGAQAPGGTGEVFDWAVARQAREQISYLVLAGGLRPENVAHAIRCVRPDAVDVSSGVERTPGQKDPPKVAAFIRAVREAQ